MVIGFFDLRLSSFERFPRWICDRQITSNKTATSYVFFYWQADVRLSDVIERLGPKASLFEFVSIQEKQISELSALMSGRHLRVLVVMAQRIPDNFVVLAAKQSDIPTLMLQHGLYVPFMKRTTALFLQNLRKTFFYLQTVVTIGRQVDVGSLRTGVAFIQHYIFGRVLGCQEFPNEKLACDLVFVHGEFWKEFHRKQFGYTHDQQIVVGSHDFNSRKVSDIPYDVSVCYVAQTLVEDGRLSRKRMEEFVREILKPISERYGNKFVLKLHPRSDVSLYDSLSRETRVESIEFPSSTVVLGHYSSLLIEAASFTDKLCIFEFEGHPTPDYLQMIASNIKLERDDVGGLVQVIAQRATEKVCSSKREAQQQKLVSFFGNPSVDSLGMAAELIWDVALTGGLPSGPDVARAREKNLNSGGHVN